MRQLSSASFLSIIFVIMKLLIVGSFSESCCHNNYKKLPGGIESFQCMSDVSDRRTECFKENGRRDSGRAAREERERGGEEEKQGSIQGEIHLLPAAGRKMNLMFAVQKFICALRTH